jgi:predicted TIM-barrel fold metal-dependent hydrolase
MGIRVMPAVPGIPIDHPFMWPIYAKCVEHNVPITINVGVPGPMRPAKLQQPMLLDEILLAFPDLSIVATHVGHPWHLEMVALMQKHPNLSLMTSGWAPKYVPQEVITFLNTRGKRQVMWASDFPLLSVERTVKEGLELPFKDDEVRDRYMGLNCIETFKLS